VVDRRDFHKPLEYLEAAAAEAEAETAKPSVEQRLADLELAATGDLSALDRVTQRANIVDATIESTP
jgi:hypothetical protein